MREMNEFMKKIKVKRIEEKEYNGKTTRYLIFETVIEEKIKIDENFNLKLEENKEYLLNIERRQYNIEGKDILSYIVKSAEKDK